MADIGTGYSSSHHRARSSHHRSGNYADTLAGPVGIDTVLQECTDAAVSRRTEEAQMTTLTIKAHGTYTITSGDGTRERCGVAGYRAMDVARDLARVTADTVTITESDADEDGPELLVNAVVDETAIASDGYQRGRGDADEWMRDHGGDDGAIRSRLLDDDFVDAIDEMHPDEVDEMIGIYPARDQSGSWRYPAGLWVRAYARGWRAALQEELETTVDDVPSIETGGVA